MALIFDLIYIYLKALTVLTGMIDNFTYQYKSILQNLIELVI